MISKKMRYRIVGIVLILVMGFCLYKIVTILLDYNKNRSVYKDIANTAVKVEKHDDLKKEDINQEQIIVDFPKLKEMNSDVVAWIYVPGTKINYPIVQGEDNQYYLNHLFPGQEGHFGSIFLDCRNAKEFSNEHSILYGHHMKDGSMFASLIKYKEPSFYQKHKYYYIVTEKKTYRVNIFSAYVATEDDDAWTLEYTTKEEKDKWLSAIKKKSCFKSEETSLDEKNIITLSTCDYVQDDARFVVHGVIQP